VAVLSMFSRFDRTRPYFLEGAFFYLLIENLTYSTYDEVYELVNNEKFHYLTMT